MSRWIFCVSLIKFIKSTYKEWQDTLTWHFSRGTSRNKRQIILRAEVSWAVTPCSAVLPLFQLCLIRHAALCQFSQLLSLHPENGDSKVLRNVGILPYRYTASQTWRPRLVSSPLWKPGISQWNVPTCHYVQVLKTKISAIFFVIFTHSYKIRNTKHIDLYEIAVNIRIFFDKLSDNQRFQ
jgi:hypothetical protein